MSLQIICTTGTGEKWPLWLPTLDWAPSVGAAALPASEWRRAQAPAGPRHSGNWWPEKNTDGDWDYIRSPDIQWYQIITHNAHQWHPGMSDRGNLDVGSSKELTKHLITAMIDIIRADSGRNNCHTCYHTIIGPFLEICSLSSNKHFRKSLIRRQQ